MFSTSTWLDAISDNDILKVKMFLDQGIDANACDEDGQTALHIAAKNGYLEVAVLLLDASVDVHATTIGETALHLSAEKGFIAINLKTY